MGAFELDEVAHHAGVVAVVREGVVAGREGLAVDGEDLAEAIETEGDDAGGFGFDGESHEVVEDLFGLHHEIGGDGVGFGEVVVGLGDGFVDGLDLAGHAAFDGADGVEVFAEFGLVGGGEGGVEAFGVGENFVEGAAAAREEVGDAGAVGPGHEEALVEEAGAFDFGQGDALAGVADLAAVGVFAGAGDEVEGGDAGLLADAVGDDLIERVGAGDFATEEVIPGVVAVGGAMIEAGEDGEVVAVRGEGFEEGRDVVVRAGLLGIEGGGVPAEVGADGDEGTDGRGGGRGEGFEGGQGERTEAGMEEAATGGGHTG